MRRLLRAGAGIAMSILLLSCGAGGGDSAATFASGSGNDAIPAGGPLQVPLAVVEPSGVARAAEPVTVGVPLPPTAGVTSAGALALFDGGTPIPAQFAVLSRWGGAATDPALPIRWVLVDFQITLAANESRTLTLAAGTPGAVASPLSVDLSDPAVAVVQTGAMEARISRQRGNVFDRVVVGGQVVCEDATPERLRSGIRLLDGDGTEYRAGGTQAPEVVVEESGPLRTVLRISSVLTSAGGSVLKGGGVRAVHRIHFYAGKSFVRVHAQLENNGVYGAFDGSFDAANAIHFDACSLDVPLSTGADRTFRTAGVQIAGTAADSWRVYQGHQVVDANDESQNFSYTVTQNGQGASAGARHAGWIDVRSASGGVTAGVRWFWQNYEKALRVAGDRVTLELWPAEGAHPPQAGSYRFEGGRRKSHEILLEFHAGPGGDPAAAMARFVAPLVPRAPGMSYHQSEALGMLDPGQVTFAGTDDDARMNAAFGRYNVLMRLRAGGVPPESGRPEPRNVPEAKERRYRIGTWDTADWYGWPHFGDFSWGDGYSSNHYDMAGFLLVHYLRLGDRALWDLAEPHVRFAAEMGQVWGVDPNPYVPSISFYEKAGHGLQGEMFRPAPSHNWIRRLVLYYWLTGHRAAYEAALFNAEALWRYFYEAFDITNPASLGFDPNEWSPLNESRFLTWTLDNVLEVWAMTGDPKWLAMCEHLAQCLLWAFGQTGHLEGAAARPPGANLMAHYGIEPLIRFHRASGNAALKAQVLDLLRGVLLSTYEADRVAPQGSGADYRPAAVANEWDGGNAQPEDYDTIFNGFAASLYAYVGWIDENAAYLAAAHRLWADGVYYPEYYSTYPDRDPVDYGTPSSWGWRSPNFPGSEEKVFARQTRAGQIYLWVMRRIQDGAGP